MINLTNNDIASRLYEAWVIIAHPDIPISDYYVSCDLADALTLEIIRPFRTQLIKDVMDLNIEDSEAQQLQYLYTQYNNLNTPETVDALVIEMYLFLIEEYLMPFHSVVKVIDGIGNMLFAAEDVNYD